MYETLAERRAVLSVKDRAINTTKPPTVRTSACRESPSTYKTSQNIGIGQKLTPKKKNQFLKASGWVGVW